MENTSFDILDTIDKIGGVLEGEDFKVSAYLVDEELYTHCERLGEAMKVPPFTALHFASIFFKCVDEDYVTVKEIASFLKINLSEYRYLISELNKLIDMGLIGKEESYSGRFTYFVHTEIKNKVYGNTVPVPETLETDLYGLSDFADRCFERVQRDRMSIFQATEYFDKLREVNPELPVCKWSKEHNISGVDFMIVMNIFHRTMNGYRSHSLGDMISSYARGGRERLSLRRKYTLGNTPLFTKGLISWEGDDVQSREYVELTEAGKIAFLGDEAKLILAEETRIVSSDLIEPEKIAVKNLYYNESSIQEMNRLEGILLPDQYGQLCERFKSQNMNAGLCVLFYGGPGTGKTESVLQLAKKTGRAIRQVDISSIKDKWVGESEKKAKAIFDGYRKLCKGLDKTPILFLNEADAIINKRINVERSVDQMNNAIQNIFLEEMEKFEGILIATTNLHNNFDPAFDRRFLYKVRFDKPSADIRAKILMDRIPGITASDAAFLAETYDLSGGQVENVARKIVTEMVISGITPGKELIEKFCNEETGFRGATEKRNKIGF
jgi:AAA+ superfamily predicted ATPase